MYYVLGKDFKDVESDRIVHAHDRRESPVISKQPKEDHNCVAKRRR
jgi:hypothetical protein